MTKIEELTDAEIEELTDAEIDIATAEHVMGWEMEPNTNNFQGVKRTTKSYWYAPCPWVSSDVWWNPSTDIACAFRVDKPEWRWSFAEVVLYDDNADGHLTLEIDLEDVPKHRRTLAHVYIPLDPTNKVPAYCRGRCIAALKACGIEELEAESGA